jgi:hypothetical protein
MKKLTSISFLLMSYFLSACTHIQTVRDQEKTSPIAESAPIEAPVEAKASVIKKNIKDQDLKKNQDDKDLKKRVVILPFLDKKSTRNLNVLKNARLAFIDSLNSTGEMIALDSSVLKLDLNNYIKDNTYDLKAIAKDSQTVGISCILEGRIIDMRFKDEDLSKVDNSSSLKTRSVSFEIVVQARMINIRSEQELFNMVKTVTIEDENSKIAENINSENFFNRSNELTELLIKDAFMDYNTKLVESLKYITWEGRIAALQGDRIFINVGQISGVQVGDILKVVDDASEIYDTELGYHLGKVPGRAKGTLEVVGFFGQDGAVSVIHSGAGFKENDRIELYQ